MFSFRLAAVCIALVVASACSSNAPRPEAAPPTAIADFCLEAEAYVVRTDVKPALQVHEDFESFVKSKASIEPLTIHQYVWYADEARTRPVMISCKLKNADHLNTVFGKGTAGPEAHCQDFNRLNHARLQQQMAPAGQEPVVFDANEEVSNTENPGMTGPDWLKPYTMTYRDEANVLHVRSKGFRVDWLDPRYQSMPGRFRGVQYCHFIAPAYLQELLLGQAAAGLVVGREVANPGPAPALPGGHGQVPGMPTGKPGS